jgi:hypothetical protein
MSGRGIGDYARDFFRNLRSDEPYGRWLRLVARNRLRARLFLGCCGHPGEPGC